jgi:predicted metal-dependent enzyme (double-stranded beta helix superfamily)
VLKGLGEPTRAGVYPVYQSSELTILNLVWGPHMTILPHDHQMWAVIGIYTGREDNIFWRRVKGDPQGRVEACAAKAVSEKQCVPLGKDIIHSVTNPVRRLTGALHVYGGDFFNEPRSEWCSEFLTERRYDAERVKRLFEESNAVLPEAPRGEPSRAA